MSFDKQVLSAAVVATLVWAGATTHAAVVPFTEDFAADNAAWKDAVGADLAFVATGGPDGGSYVSGSYSFISALDSDTPVLLRGQGNLDASGDAFVGDWLAEGVTQFTAWVRHDAPFPLTYFARLAKPANFPAAVGISFVPVLPNTWTQVSFDISALNPQFVTFEGSDFNTVFSGIGNVQLGVSVSAALAGYAPAITFDLDQPAITPEPATFGVVSAAAALWLRRRGRIPA